ncbi:MAG: beta-lactamase family protein [Planctomycetes bacterium]|nr:beta-lactamase family protein [Planctomycetota bacterium]
MLATLALPLLAALAPAAASPLARVAAADEPTLEMRLERLAEDLEARRELLHISGLSLAVVHQDRVIFARGFGLVDREAKRPAEATTLYPIGSVSKTFTALLVASLAEEGKLDWEKRPATWLDGFRFKDKTTDAKATLDDLLSHRTGLTRTDVAWLGGAATRDELVRLLAETDNQTAYRGAWQYNNAMFLVAGECAARVTGKSWDELVAERFFAPLGMTRTTSSAAVALADPALSKRYDWDAAGEKFVAVEWVGLDNMAAAGGICSDVVDMAQWVRFLLKRGAWGEGRLVADAQFDRLWKDDDDLKPSYGRGFFLHEDDGQEWRDAEGGKHKLIEHGGNVPGYAAAMSVLPDRDCGLVMLSNTSQTQLQAGIHPLVYDALFGKWKERRPLVEGAPLPKEAYEKLAGTFTGGIEGRPNNSLVVMNGRLVLVIPPGLGQWATTTYTLGWPDKDGRCWLREEPDSWIEIQKDDAGHALALTLTQGFAVRRMKAVAAKEQVTASDLSLDEFFAKRAEAAGADAAAAVRTLRLAGQLSFPQSGVTGSYTLLARGPDELRIDFDASPFGKSTLIVSGERGSFTAQFGSKPQLTPAEVAALRFANPLVQAGSWLDFADEVDLQGVTRATGLGAPLPELALAIAVKTPGEAPGSSEPSSGFYVSAKDFRLLAIEGGAAFPGLAFPLPIALLTDVRDVGGMKIAFRRELQTPDIGTVRLQFSEGEVDVELDDALFALPPPPAPGS